MTVKDTWRLGLDAEVDLAAALAATNDPASATAAAARAET